MAGGAHEWKTAASRWRLPRITISTFEKKEAGGRTVAEIGEIEGEARTREIGRMLSGERVTREALQQAEQLLKIGAEPVY